jgi:geranylgeranyl pyrophosphate synthase
VLSVLAEAFADLSPQLADRYRALLERELADSPELNHLHQLYLEYALRDRHLPRPVLAYFGYHGLADVVHFADTDRIGDALLLPQLLRDVLAIRDDVVDEDLEKFGGPPLPVALSSDGGTHTVLTQHGKNLALYYGDFLVGVMMRVAAAIQPALTAAAATRLIGDILYINQRGQLAELRAESVPLTETTINDLLLIGQRKAAYYCYVFPFAIGSLLADHDHRRIAPVLELLTRIGTASQVIDDLTGAFPGVIDHDKDTLGEIANLRRTVPLVLLAHHTRDSDTRALLTAIPPLPGPDANRLREKLWNSDVPTQALRLCTRLVDDIEPALADLRVGKATATYLRELVQHRLVDSIQRLRNAL